MKNMYKNIQKNIVPQKIPLCTYLNLKDPIGPGFGVFHQHCTLIFIYIR